MNEVNPVIDIAMWSEMFLQTVNHTFNGRVYFVGLQGSYARNEATENSDLDMVVILDELTPKDIDTYNAMLDTLPNREIICGFLSGKDEIEHWDPADLFQFYFDTKPLQGGIDELLPLLDHACVKRAIKIGVCNIYHGCVHNMLFDKNDDILKNLFKAASFVVQAICYQQTGKYYANQNELSERVSPQERLILSTYQELKSEGTIRFGEMSEILFAWAKYWINHT